MRSRLLPLCLAALFVGTPAYAEQPPTPSQTTNARCPHFYLDGRAPQVVGAPGRTGGRVLCHSFYVISYSTTLRNPLWTSYRLTRGMAEGGDRISRYRGNFRRERGLTRDEQGAHGDYVNPPFDRGHLTPANDAVDMPSQRDTFVITNSVPQISEFNRGLWRFLESSVHQLAKDEDEVYVVTGAVFAAEPPPMRRPGRPGRIAVPEATFKAIYIPAINVAVGYLATNSVTTQCTIISIAELTRRTGVNPFPSLAPLLAEQVPDFVLPEGAGTDLPNCSVG